MNTEEQELGTLLEGAAWGGPTWEETFGSAPLTPELLEEAIMRVYRYEALAAAAKAAKKEAQAQEEQYEGNAKLARAMILGRLKQAGITKMSTPIGSAHVMPPKERLVVAEGAHALQWPAEIAAACVSLDVKVNKQALKGMFSDRLSELEGVSIEKGEESLTIR